MRRFALYTNFYGSLGHVVIEPMGFNISDSMNLRSTGLHAIESIFREAAGDEFSGRGAILVERQESGSTSVFMGSWNKSV